MIIALRKDDAVTAEAAILEGLDVQSEYKNHSECGDFDDSLLHWAAILDAPKCAKVHLASMI